MKLYISPHLVVKPTYLGLGRANGMRFKHRKYTTAPYQPRQPIRGKLVLHDHDPNGASAQIPDGRSINDVYHLRFAGATTISL